jgi:hypothetical protein
MPVTRESPLTSHGESNSPPGNYRQIYAPAWIHLTSGAFPSRPVAAQRSYGGFVGS